MVKLRVAPVSHPATMNSNSPCGKSVPAGGGSETTLTGTNSLWMKPQPAPPPVKLTSMVPLPVAEAPE